ncbi:hypothetical protein D3C76_1043330 [compost metagenome]
MIGISSHWNLNKFSFTFKQYSVITASYIESNEIPRDHFTLLINQRNSKYCSRLLTRHCNVQRRKYSVSKVIPFHRHMSTLRSDPSPQIVVPQFPFQLQIMTVIAVREAGT